jgi:uncharacterized membrane protein YheB (UPF0754 family)
MDPRFLLIPLVTGLIGWGTNALAIRMLFSPVQRVGGKRLGWQGVLPAHAERMATICVRLMTTRLLDIRAVFQRIESERISELLSPILEKHAEEIVEDVLAHRYPRVWETLPERVRSKARSRLRAEIPTVVEKLMAELHDDLDRYLDVEELVVDAFQRNRELLNELFWECGREEFRFISRSGLLFGFLFGLVQALIWFFIQPSWLLPLTGVIVGWATNWLALKMVFRPLEPRKMGPMRWQGLFLQRQAEVSEAYANFFADRILHPEALVGAVLRGPAAERLVAHVQRYISHAVDHASGTARPLVQLAVGTREWLELKQEITQRLVSILPSELDRVHEYAGEALDLKEELRVNMSDLPPKDFEQVLRPVFQEDEATLIAVGALLGGLAGVLQWVLVTAF